MWEQGFLYPQAGTVLFAGPARDRLRRRERRLCGEPRRVVFGALRGRRDRAPGPLMSGICAGHRLPDGCIGCSAARRRAKAESWHGLRDSSVFPGCRSGGLFPPANSGGGAGDRRLRQLGNPIPGPELCACALFVRRDSVTLHRVPPERRKCLAEPMP